MFTHTINVIYIYTYDFYLLNVTYFTHMTYIYLNGLYLDL